MQSVTALFKEALVATNNNCRIGKLNCEHFLFNPFELKDTVKDAIPCDEYDPDIHYYSDSQNICDSSYFDIDEFNATISKSKLAKRLSMNHCNIRSASKNSNDFSNYLDALNCKFDIIALSETWLSDNNSDIVGFPNYDQVHKFREHKRGGGVSLLMRGGKRGSSPHSPQIKIAILHSPQIKIVILHSP